MVLSAEEGQVLSNVAMLQYEERLKARAKETGLSIDELRARDNEAQQKMAEGFNEPTGTTEPAPGRGRAEAQPEGETPTGEVAQVSEVPEGGATGSEEAGIA